MQDNPNYHSFSQFFSEIVISSLSGTLLLTFKYHLIIKGISGPPFYRGPPKLIALMSLSLTRSCLCYSQLSKVQ